MQREQMLTTNYSSAKTPPSARSMTTDSQFPWLLVLLLSMFVLFALVSVAPLNRLAGSDLLSSLPMSSTLLRFGAALPVDLHLTANSHASQVNTDSIEFLSVMAMLFLLYAFAMLYLRRIHVLPGYTKALAIIWIRGNSG